MGLLLFVIGLLLWLVGGYFIVGLILMIVGLFLFFSPGVPYGYSAYRGRRGPPV